jgi:hypothetical protein
LFKNGVDAATQPPDAGFYLYLEFWGSAQCVISAGTVMD